MKCEIEFLPVGGATKAGDAIVIRYGDTSKHPRQIVLNAFLRRGARIAITRGDYVRYGGGFPGRFGDVPTAPVPFSTVVEEYT